MKLMKLYDEEAELISLIRLYRTGYPNNKYLNLEIRPLLNEMMNPEWTPSENKED